MGRFRDLWASGKFIREDKEQQAKFQQREAAGAYQEMSPEFAVPDGTKAIFDALKSRRGQETGRWLRDITPEQIASQGSVQPAAPTVNVFDDTVGWIATLFKEFGELAYEFNKTAVGTDFLISVERPTVHEKKSDEVWYRPVQKSVEGRLTTRQWALIVLGLDKKISIVLLPSTMLLAFTGGQVADDEYPPFMEIAYSDRGEWTIGGEVMPRGAIPHLAKELLGDLIRVSSGSMSETELFSTSKDKPQMGQNMGVGYAKPAQAEESPAARGNFSSTDTIHDACDVVDATVDRELKRLYALAANLQPTSPDANGIRKQISAVETFHQRILEAFEQYSHATQARPKGQSETAEKPAVELLH